MSSRENKNLRIDSDNDEYIKEQQKKFKDASYNACVNRLIREHNVGRFKTQIDEVLGWLSEYFVSIEFRASE